VTQDPSIDADLLILGGGMAGMTAGGYAASRGARPPQPSSASVTSRPT